MEIFRCREFISMTKEEPLKWTNYCEIIITHSGHVMLARPSHTMKIIEYAMFKEDKSKEEIVEELRSDYLAPIDFYIDKYGILAVWYDHIYVSKEKGTNPSQQRTIEALQREGLLADTINYVEVDEYERHLKRKEISKYGL